MKKCEKPQNDYLKNRNHKVVVNALTQSKKKKFRKLRKLNQKKKYIGSNAPHNTSSYIMNQHPIKEFDQDELFSFTMMRSNLKFVDSLNLFSIKTDFESL